MTWGSFSELSDDEPEEEESESPARTREMHSNRKNILATIEILNIVPTVVELIINWIKYRFLIKYNKKRRRIKIVVKSGYSEKTGYHSIEYS